MRECWCARCDDEARAAGSVYTLWLRMNLCPKCGNKRCPRATHRDNECTGSNEPGQSGSDYQ